MPTDFDLTLVSSSLPAVVLPPPNPATFELPVHRIPNLASSSLHSLFDGKKFALVDTCPRPSTREPHQPPPLPKRRQAQPISPLQMLRMRYEWFTKALREKHKQLYDLDQAVNTLCQIRQEKEREMMTQKARFICERHKLEIRSEKLRVQIKRKEKRLAEMKRKYTPRPKPPVPNHPVPTPVSRNENENVRRSARLRKEDPSVSMLNKTQIQQVNKVQ